MSIEVMSESNSGPEEDLPRIPSTRSELEEKARQAVGGELTKENITQALKQPHEVDIPPEAIVDMAALVPEIPPGLAPDAFKNYVHTSIEALEKSNHLITTDVIEAWGVNITSYGGIGAVEKNKILTEVEARLCLAGGALYLGLQRYDEFRVLFSMLNKDRWNALRDEVLKNEGLQTIRNIELNSGRFFRLSKDDQEIRKQQLLNQLRLTGGLTVEEANNKWQVIMRLFDTTGMSGFYTGRVDATGQLVDQQLMDHMVGNVNHIPSTGITPARVLTNVEPNVPGAPTDERSLAAYPMLIYWRNENLWEAKRQYRLQHPFNRPIPPTASLPFPEDPQADAPSTAALRRLMYFPEELENLVKIGRYGGRAESLRYAAELYVVSLPHYNGVSTLSEFLGGVGAAERLAKKGETWRWAGLVKGANDTAGAMLAWLEEPIKGGERVEDVSQLANNFDNLLGVIAKDSGYVKYLSLMPNMLDYATSSTVEATINYINGNSPDRRRQFPKLPRLGPEFRYGIANIFTQFMSPDRKNRLLQRVGAPESRIRTKQTSQTAVGWLTDIAKAFLGQLGKR